MTTKSKSPKSNASPAAEPPFFAALVKQYESGTACAFVLSLNTRDYAVPGVRLPAYIAGKLGGREIVARYDRANGITFAAPLMRAAALAVLGLDKAQAPDPTLAALGLGTPAANAGEVELPRNPAQALPLLTRLLQSDRRAVVIIESLETITPAADVAAMGPDDRDALVALAGWGTDKRIEAAGGLAIALCDNIAAVNGAIRSAASGWSCIDVPLPDYETRRAFAAWYAAQDDRVAFNDDMPLEAFARATAGLSLVGIENILLRAVYSNAPLSIDLAREEKRRIIESEYAGLLEIIEPTLGFDDIGGLETLKAWARANVIEPIKAGHIGDVPKGVLLTGAPGTGKTFFVSALAREVGFNMAALNLENILGGVVGVSERNLSRSFQAVQSMAPAICFIDEIDQSDIAARGNGSGNPVAKNLFSMLLRFIGDPANRGKVVFVMATNRPDLIDPALLRFGRIDAIIPMFLPDATERAAVVKAQAKAQGIGIEPAAADHIVAGADGYSNADIAAIVAKARKAARAAGLKVIDAASAERAARSIRPATLGKGEYYTQLAVEACNDMDLIPPRYAAMMAARPAPAQEPAADAAGARRGGRAL